MPIDASLYGNLQPPKFNTPFEVLGQMDEIRQRRDQAQAITEQRAAQTAKLTQETAEAERKHTEEASWRQALQGAYKPDGSLDQEALFKAVPPELMPLAQKTVVESQAIFQNFQKETAERKGTLLKDMATRVRQLGDNPMVFGTALRSLVSAGALSENEATTVIQRAGAGPGGIKSVLDSILHPEGQKLTEHDPTKALVDPQGNVVKAGIPKPVEAPAVGGFEDYVMRFAADRKLNPANLSAGQIRAAKAQYEAAGRAPVAPKDERLVQIMKDGAATWVRESEAVGKPAAQAARGVTGIERQTLAFYNRAQEAAKTVEPLEEKIGQMGLGAQARLQMAPNFAQSPENQSYRQAQRSFTEARLRKESGAAIPPQEYENDSKTYFAQPGDGPKILEQKRKARQTVLDGLAFSSGKAYDEYYGEPRAGTKAPGSGGSLIKSITEVK